MNIAVRVDQGDGQPPSDVLYRWDADTEILCASVRNGRRTAAVRETASAATVEVEGRDGSWLVLDVADGGVAGVEVAVWPDVHKRSSLSPPAEVEDARVTLALGAADPLSHEVTTSIAAESDAGARTIHFTLGPRRPTRAVRVARDLLLDIDRQDRLAGLWLLNVPPSPQPT